MSSYTTVNVKFACLDIYIYIYIWVQESISIEIDSVYGFGINIKSIKVFVILGRSKFEKRCIMYTLLIDMRYKILIVRYTL